jgi:hypothetical protein
MYSGKIAVPPGGGGIVLIITREIPCTTHIIFSFVFDNFLYFQATTFETEN